MGDGYGGDSVGKKLARAVFWLRVLRTTYGIKARYVYLASAEGGDAATLRGLGVPPEQQLALDRDPVALTAFREKFPGVETVNCDAREFFTRTGERFAGVYMDFCTYASPPLVEAMSAAVRRTHTLGVCAFAVMRGRETGVLRGDINLYKSPTELGERLLESSAHVLEVQQERQLAIDAHLHAQNKLAQAMHDLIDCYRAVGDLVNIAAVEKELAELKDRGSLTRSAVDTGIDERIHASLERFVECANRTRDGRAQYMRAGVFNSALLDNIGIRRHTDVVYHSRANDRRGVPMLIVACGVKRYPASMRYSEVRQRAFDAMKTLKEQRAWFIKDSRTSVDVRDLIERPGIEVDFNGATLANVVQVADALQSHDRVRDIASVFNTTPRHLAAWRAHVTRGSYVAGNTVAG